ncbi:MAG: hypothetical protein M1812_007804 [Candelaria pacifica]|nr:MAG: hypothetical protein M1812_007804 [Candelaria pacifica]
MLWRWTLYLLSSGLLRGTIVPVSTFPFLTSPWDDTLIANSKEPTTDLLKEALLATDASTKALGLRDVKKATYRICRRKDGLDCYADVACAITKYISAPLQFIVFGVNREPGERYSPMALLPTFTLAVCYVRESVLDSTIPDRPPTPKEDRSLMLEAPSDKQSPFSLIPREDDKPTYWICRRKDGQACILDLSCWTVNYISSPALLILFGIWQWEEGPHLGVVHLIPPAMIIMCNKVQNMIHNTLNFLDEINSDNDPTPKRGRSLTLEAPSTNSSPGALLSRDATTNAYTVCRRADKKGCLLDATCFALKYITTPISLILFGVRQIQEGPNMAPAYLLAPISVLLCPKFQKGFDDSAGPGKAPFSQYFLTQLTDYEQDTPPETKNTRSLTLEAPPTSPGALIPRDVKVPTYTICRRIDRQGCFVDATCAAIKYIGGPVALIIFGRAQLYYGPHISPFDTVPPIVILLCNRLQRWIDRITGPSKPPSSLDTSDNAPD